MNKLEVTEFGVGVVATMLANTLKEIDKPGQSVEVCLNLTKVGENVFFRPEARWNNRVTRHAVSGDALNLSDPLAGSKFADSLTQLVANVHARRSDDTADGNSK